MKPKTKKKSRAYHSRASKVAAESDPDSREWIALLGVNPDRSTPAFRAAEVGYRLKWTERDGEGVPEAIAFVLSAWKQGNADALRKLADAMDLVWRFRAYFEDNGRLRPALADDLGFWLSDAYESVRRILLEPNEKPTARHYQTFLSACGCHATTKTIRERVHAMGLPLAGRGAPRIRKQIEPPPK